MGSGESPISTANGDAAASLAPSAAGCSAKSEYLASAKSESAIWKRLHESQRSSSWMAFSRRSASRWMRAAGIFCKSVMPTNRVPRKQCHM